MKIKHNLVIFSLGILSITGVYAGQTLGAILTTSATCSVSSKTNSVTTTASTTVLLVPVVHHASADTVSVTFNGVALTLYSATTTGGIDVEAWALSSPPVGTYNLVTTVNSSAYCIAHGAYVIRGSASSTTLSPIISTRSLTSTNFSWIVTTNQASTSTRTYVFGVAQSGSTINASSVG